MPEFEYYPFQPELDLKYPVDLMNFGPKDKEAIVAGTVNPLAWSSLFRNSPANSMEAEALIGRIIIEAVRAGQWVDTPAPIADEIVEPLTVQTPGGGNLTINPLTYEYLRGADLLCQIGFTQRMIDETGRNYLRPTEVLMEFVGQRIGFKQVPETQ